MATMQVGDKVIFRLASPLPRNYRVPAHAIGTVVRKYVEPRSGQEWLDVDFGVGVGFVFAVASDELNIEMLSLRAPAPSGEVANAR
jgi:hypothetical protein